MLQRTRNSQSDRYRAARIGDPVLMVLHQERSTAGRVGHHLSGAGFEARHSPSRAGRSAARDAGGSFRRRRVRRSDERQRRDRFHQARDRLACGAAAREEAVSRHLSRRADAGAPSWRNGFDASGRQGGDRLLSVAHDGGRAQRDAGLADRTSINGIAKDLRCRTAPTCWPKAIFSRCRHFATDRRPTASSFMPKSRTP